MRNRLAAIQSREGLTDGQMAARLGIARPTWNRIKNGHLRVSDLVAVRAAGAFPELTRELLDRSAESVRTAANDGRSAA